MSTNTYNYYNYDVSPTFSRVPHDKFADINQDGEWDVYLKDWYEGHSIKLMDTRAGVDRHGFYSVYKHDGDLANFNLRAEIEYQQPGMPLFGVEEFLDSGSYLIGNEGNNYTTFYTLESESGDKRWAFIAHEDGTFDSWNMNELNGNNLNQINSGSGDLKLTYELRDASVQSSTTSYPATPGGVPNDPSYVVPGGDSNDTGYAVSGDSPSTYTPSSSALESIAILGPGSDESKKFILDIRADNFTEYDVESGQFTVDYDAAFFNDVSADDIWISSPSIANSVKIDNTLGEITIAAASLSDLIPEGDATSDIIASIQFDFNESAFRNYQDINLEDSNGKYARLSFDIDVNEHETVLSKEIVDGSGFTNREIKSINELGFNFDVEGQDTTLFKAFVNLEEQGDGLTLGTERIIGSTESIFTNLIRSGDIVTARSTWKNEGNIKGENITVVGLDNDNGYVVDYRFTDILDSSNNSIGLDANDSLDTPTAWFRGEHTNFEGYLSDYPASYQWFNNSWSQHYYDENPDTNALVVKINTDGSNEVIPSQDINYNWDSRYLEFLDWKQAMGLEGSQMGVFNQEGGSNMSTSLSSHENIKEISSINGGYFNGDYRTDTQQSTEIEIDINVTGTAGNVIDLSGDTIYQLKADGVDTDGNPLEFDNTTGSKNLITFQGDLNYDGRVSMKDLAYLNAGAARQELDGNNNVVEGSVARDVDADFSGKIDLADLAVLDADWGKTLHTGDETFQGSSNVSWDLLDNQGTTGDATWDNTAFKIQNEIEYDLGNINQTLNNPTAVGVIGGDDQNNNQAVNLLGEDFQDQLIA